MNGLIDEFYMLTARVEPGGGPIVAGEQQHSRTAGFARPRRDVSIAAGATLDLGGTAKFWILLSTGDAAGQAGQFIGGSLTLNNQIDAAFGGRLRASVTDGIQQCHGNPQRRQ